MSLSNFGILYGQAYFCMDRHIVRGIVFGTFIVNIFTILFQIQTMRNSILIIGLLYLKSFVSAQRFGGKSTYMDA